MPAFTGASAAAAGAFVGGTPGFSVWIGSPRGANGLIGSPRGALVAGAWAKRIDPTTAADTNPIPPWITDFIARRSMIASGR
jgi:hypothetical protein